MYESPIEIRQTSTQYTAIFDKEKDSMILKAVQGVGVNVDKEELLKALKYDRQQYQKGYADGIEEVNERLAEFLVHCDHISPSVFAIIRSFMIDLVKKMGCG